MGIAGRNAGGILIALTLAALPLRSAAPFDSPRADPSLQEVLARTATYVKTLHEQLSGIVAEEIYVQEVRRLRAVARPPRNELHHQTLRSDLLLVRSPAEDRYIEFRDVFEVNGHAVRDRQERLTNLFLSTTPEAVDQIRAIVDESARHNIGAVLRNINTPMLTLSFLQQDEQWRFRFRRAKRGQPELATSSAMHGRDAAVFRVVTEMWVVAFREVERPTLIRTDRGRNFPARGRFWIDPETGAVLMSELVMRNSTVTGTINVSYQSEPLLGFLVPVEMRERYEGRAERVEGLATYGRFRQFQVRTRESLTKPPGAIE